LPDFSRSKHTKAGKYTKWMQTIPNGLKLYQMAEKIFRMIITYNHILNSKDLQNLPKLEFLVWKQTIWQPWWRIERNCVLENISICEVTPLLLQQEKSTFDYIDMSTTPHPHTHNGKDSSRKIFCTFKKLMRKELIAFFELLQMKLAVAY
jgi:hypothetical protein